MKQKITQLQPSEDLGILVGLLLTDGCVTGVSSGKPKVIFTNKSEFLQSFFKEKFIEVFGKTNFKEFLRSNGVTNIEVNSKKIVTELLKLTPTFRTRQFEDGTFPNVKIPEFMKELPIESLRKVLQAMFSADGCVILRVRLHNRKKKWEILREIKLSCKHPQLKEETANLLRRLELNPKIRSDCIALTRKQDMVKFQKEIRFVDGLKVGENMIWDGIEKNFVLDLLVKTFDLKESAINKFNSKSEIISFLKTLMAPAINRHLRLDAAKGILPSVYPEEDLKVSAVGKSTGTN